MNKSKKVIIFRIISVFLIIVAWIPSSLFIYTSPSLVWVQTSTFIYTPEGQDNITIQNPNPLLENKYILIVGDEFASYIGFVDGNVTIMDKATRVNQTFQILIDATTHYVSWSTDSHIMFLSLGEYTIFWQFDPFMVDLYIYSYGWFMIEDPTPDQVNDSQGTAIFMWVLFAIASLVIIVVINIKIGKKP